MAVKKPPRPRTRTSNRTQTGVAKPRARIRPLLIFPEASQLSAEQQEGICWIGTRMASVASAWEPQKSANDGKLVDDFLHTIVTIINLRNQLAASTPPAAEPLAEQVLDALDDDLASFLKKCNGFDLPRFRALAEGMMLALAYADLHHILREVKHKQKWNQLQAGSEFLAILKSELCKYVSEDDAKELVRIVALKAVGNQLGRDDVHRTTITALAEWRGQKSERWVEDRLGLLKSWTANL